MGCDGASGGPGPSTGRVRHRGCPGAPDRKPGNQAWRKRGSPAADTRAANEHGPSPQPSWAGEAGLGDGPRCGTCPSLRYPAFWPAQRAGSGVGATCRPSLAPARPNPPGPGRSRPGRSRPVPRALSGPAAFRPGQGPGVPQTPNGTPGGFPYGGVAQSWAGMGRIGLAGRRISREGTVRSWR